MAETAAVTEESDASGFNVAGVSPMMPNRTDPPRVGRTVGASVVVGAVVDGTVDVAGRAGTVLVVATVVAGTVDATVEVVAVGGGAATVDGGGFVSAVARITGTTAAAATMANTSGAHRLIFSRGGAGSNAQPRSQTSSKVVIVKTIDVITV